MTVLPTWRLVKGSTWWCVSSAEYAARSFNPNTTASMADSRTGGRFHPLGDIDGVPIPTKYLADHPNGAFAEVLMRSDETGAALSRARVDGHRLARLSLQRDLTVVDLGASPSDTALDGLLRRGREAYVPLRRIASAVHQHHPDVSGLIWRGYQLASPGMLCVVLFGDRVNPEDLLELEVHRLQDGIGLRLMREAALLRRVLLPSALAIDGDVPFAAADRPDAWDQLVSAAFDKDERG